MSGASETAAGEGPMREQFRGTGVLLLGRVLSIVLNLLTHVVLVRHLARAEYGSFGYALALTGLAANVAMLGLARSMSRFGPLYGERRDAPLLSGAIVVALGTIGAVGVVLLTLGFALDGRWQPLLTDDPLSARLLLTLLALTPLTALDAVLEVLTGAFAGARAILFRRHMLTPGLRFLVVLVGTLLDWGPVALAWAYMAVAVVGVTAYGRILVRALRERHYPAPRLAALPFGPVLGYGASMMLLDLAGVAILHLPAVVLEAVRGSDDVAHLRAVIPLATLSLVVLQSLKLLYLPHATRSHVRGGAEALSAAHWAATRWVALLGFPIFAACAFLSPELVGILFGAEYVEAAPLATIMAAGYYVHSIVGFNTLTLQAAGLGKELRLTAVAGVTAAAVGNALLVPSFGAVGAACATSLTLLAHDLTNLFVARRAGILSSPGPGYSRPFLVIGTASALLVVLVWGVDVPPAVRVPLVVAVALVTWWANRRELDLLQSFPELGRIPGVRRLLG